MKTFNFQKNLPALFAGAGLLLSTITAVAQNFPPQLPYGVPQVLQLAQAKVPDDTIVAYIHNSGNKYNLNADQIIYLRQQGISDNVINVMLSQPGLAASAPSADNSYTAQVPTPQTPAPAVVTQSAPNVYVVPSPQPYYYNAYTQPIYYPSYSYFPAVSLSFGFGSGYYYGSGYHGGYYGYHGGYYGGYHGGYYGGYHGGYHGGGWHH